MKAERLKFTSRSDLISSGALLSQYFSILLPLTKKGTHSSATYVVMSIPLSLLSFETQKLIGPNSALIYHPDRLGLFDEFLL